MPVIADHLRTTLPTGCRGRFKCLAEYLEWEAHGSRFSAFEPARPDERVYFIGPDHGPVKIGLTTNVGQRLDHLQTGSPYELKVLAVVHAGAASSAPITTPSIGTASGASGSSGRRTFSMRSGSGASGHSAAHRRHKSGHTGGCDGQANCRMARQW
jgi:hypothetical protein